MMTLNKPTYRSFFKIALIIPFVILLSIAFGCEPASRNEDNPTEQVSLELIDNKTIRLNGKTVSASELGKAFADLSIDPEHTLIELKTHENISMSLITDVQNVLRENGALRINYSTLQPNETQSKGTGISSIEGRNLLNIHIDNEGTIIASQDTIPLSSLGILVKKFITNNGEEAALSETPADAIIAIKTDKETPHDAYTRMFDTIIGVYDELRNQASMDLFSKPYTKLTRGSEEQNRIQNMYPRQISISEPSQS